MGISNFLTYAEKVFSIPLTSVYDRGESRNHEENVFIDDVFRLCSKRLALDGIYWKPEPLGQKIVQGICVDMSSFCYSVILDTVNSNQQDLRYRCSPPLIPADVLKTESQLDVTTTGYESQRLGVSNMLANAFGNENLSKVFNSVKKSKISDIFESLEIEENVALECIAEIEIGEKKGMVDKPPASVMECPDDILLEDISVSVCSTNRNGKKRANTHNSDSGDGSEPAIKKKTRENFGFSSHRTAVETDLSASLIQECAQACYNKLYNVIGSQRIARAHYFSLHFDENTTSCKWFEQYKRITSKNILVSKESRSRVFLETLRLVQKRLVGDTKELLLEEFSRRPRISEMCYKDEDVFHLLSDEEFIQEVVLRKMQLTRSGPNCDIMRQSFTSGEGEWKCVYVTRDIEDESAERSENVHHRWFLFGHDWDIALAMLLYTTTRASMYYIYRPPAMISLPIQGLPKRPEEYKALHFLTLCLVGNDYVPRLVNASVRNMVALATEVNRMLNSKVRHCKTYLNTWSNVFRDPRNRIATDSERSDFALATAYIIARLLKAVYGSREPGYDSADTSLVDESFDRSYTTGLTGTSRSVKCNTMLLRSKDGGNLSFSDCVKMFVSCAMWYAAYCMFYMNMSPQSRNNFRKTRNAEDIQLYNPALPMKTCYKYNEPRHVQFELANVVDVRRVLNNISTYDLIGTIVNSVTDVLEG